MAGKDKDFTYVILKNDEVYAVTHYLSVVEEYTNIPKNTLSVHFNNLYSNKNIERNKNTYIRGEFKVVKCYKVDFKGNYKGNSINLLAKD